MRHRVNNVSSSISILVDTLEELYDQTRLITPAYIRDVAQRIFGPEINTVRDATLAQGLTLGQTTCVETANRELKAVLVRGKQLT